MSIGELTGKNVTKGPEISERNERTVRATVFYWWGVYVQVKVRERRERV